jgi:hypothetical protein
MQSGLSRGPPLWARCAKNLDRRARARVRAMIYGRRLPGCERAFLEAESREAARQRVWDERESRIAAVQAEFRDRCLLDLQTVLDQKGPDEPILSTDEMVNRALSRGRRRAA